jgi:hypothetical protein
MDVNQRITNEEMWTATALFVGMDVIALSPLPFLLRKLSPLELLQPMGIASALFWGILMVLLLFKAWNLYYCFFYPGWVRWIAPLDIVIYGAIGLGLWWLVAHLTNAPLFWFILLGGLEGMAEHVLGIYGFRILEKVPWLMDVRSLPALVFSFFEYVFYWALVVWLAFGIHELYL